MWIKGLVQLELPCLAFLVLWLGCKCKRAKGYIKDYCPQIKVRCPLDIQYEIDIWIKATLAIILAKYWTVVG